MAHLHQLGIQLQPRINRIKGQLEGLERALMDEKSCVQVLQQAAAIRGAMNGLLHTILEEHVRHHLTAKPDSHLHADEEQVSTEELLKIIKTYLK